MKTEVFTSDIKCKVYKPMAGKVKYGDEVGIPHVEDAETAFEVGSKYTICSPLSPYALGWKRWELLCDMADGKSLSDVFDAEVDFEKSLIRVFRKV